MKPSASSPHAGRAKKKKPAIKRYSVTNLPEPTEKQWAQFNTIREENIDCSDIPELDEQFWKNAKLMPALLPAAHTKKAVSLRIDPDVLDWFKQNGKRYQSRINAVLRAYVEAQRNS